MKHLVRAAISRENHHQSLQRWKTFHAELSPRCWEEQVSGASNPQTSPSPTASAGAMRWWVPAPQHHTLQLLLQIRASSSASFQSRLHQDMEKIHPVLRRNRPRHEGDPRIYPRPPADFSSHPKTSLRSKSR